VSAVIPGFEYAPAPDAGPSPPLRERYGLFVGGEWVAAAGEALFPAIDPATETTLALLAQAGAADVDKAVRAARRGYDKYWRKLAPRERAKYLFRIAGALRERGHEFARLEALDAGLPLRGGRELEFPQAAAGLFYHAGWADKLAFAVQAPERIRALGVVGAIVSSSTPLAEALAKVGPALACGNTVVLKPDECTSLSALAFAQVCREADLPPGTVNVVTGDARAGLALADHADIDKLAFSGSPEIGKKLARAFAGTNKRLSLQLAGTPHALVYDDAPLDQALEGVIASAFLTGGRRAGDGCALLVQESAYDEFVERMRERLATLRHGNPLDENTDVGPLVSRSRRDALAERVRAGSQEGAMLVQADWQPPELGFWFPAAFFTNVQPGSQLARERLAGPLVTVRSFRTVEEALSLAAELPPGPFASVWTSSGQLAFYTAQRCGQGSCGATGTHVSTRAHRAAGPAKRGSAGRAELPGCESIWRSERVRKSAHVDHRSVRPIPRSRGARAPLREQSRPNGRALQRLQTRRVLRAADTAPSSAGLLRGSHPGVQLQ
jgi:aldehyde dehydrogenase (NAD+)